MSVRVVVPRGGPAREGPAKSVSLRFRRIVAAFLTCALALLAVGCTTKTATTSQMTSPHVGIVTGIASPCWPYPFTKGIRKSPVTVTVTRDGQSVATQMVRGDHVYHLTLAPGGYLVSTLYSPAKPVTIVVGLAAKVDLPNDCQ
jgi:hypothetical protein